MTIEIKSINLGIAATNCYIVGDTETNEALVIDPVDQATTLYKIAKDAGWDIKLILATHGHFDHVLAARELKELTGAPFLIHPDSVPLMKNLAMQGVRFTGKPFPQEIEPDRLLTTKPKTIEVGAIKLETLYTPGHAPGHISFFMRDHDILFSGDTLFAGSVGRTDLIGGSYPLLMQSIFEKLIPLGDDVQVLAGHMQPTTIGRERTTNPFLLQYANE